ncbi:glycerate kinase [Mycobacterium sp. URHB0021]
MVFAPQKGASAANVEHLETGLRQLVSGIKRTGWPDAGRWAVTPGAGSAGGIGFAALMVGGRIVSGGDYFLDLLDFDGRAHGADLVITGEGRLDDLTLAGKLPVVVARWAAPTPVVVVVGHNSMTARTPVFSQICAVAELSEDDTADDPVRTAALLRQIGANMSAPVIKLPRSEVTIRR